MLSREKAVQGYVAVAVALTLIVAGFVAQRFGGTADFSSHGVGAMLGFTVLALLADLAESNRSAGIAGSVAFVVHLGSVLALGPIGAGIVVVISTAAAQIWMRRPAIKGVFNATQMTLSTLAGASAYMLAGGNLQPRTLTDSDIAAFGALVVTYFTVNSSAVSGVVAVSQQQRFREVWVRNAWGLAGYDLVASTLGLLVAGLYLRFGFYGLAGVVIPLLFLRHVYGMNQDLQKANRELLDLMVKAIEARDPYTSGHSQRVAEYARALSREVGLSGKQTEVIATAALLHDVGKIYEEYAPLLRKETKLTPDERLLLQSHPVRSAELVATISSLQGPVAQAVRHHHENFDGSGYPDGLSGGQIPIGARIIMIADTIDAMTTDRPYRRALTLERALEELNKHAGRQFDPKLVKLVSRSASVRRLLGPQLASDVPLPASFQGPSRVARSVARGLR